MRLSVHLTFAGQCEEAFKFYERCLAGTGLALFKYGDAPGAEQLSPEWRGKIVHASPTIGDALLAGADVRAEDYESPRGFYVLLGIREVVEAERVFHALAEGGAVRMPLQKTFWSPCFGVVVDRFGTPWEVSAEPQ
jgi:PhnB protein